MQDAILIQQTTSSSLFMDSWANTFTDMQRLSFPRHAAYARGHGFDFWSIFGDLNPKHTMGAWGKIQLIQQALSLGYQYIAWVDADAAVADMSCDLRDALPKDGLIGACEHYAPWFAKNQIPRHFNVGVLYLRSDPRTVQFVNDWLSRYPGDPRWMEQGAFNSMITEPQYSGIFTPVDAEWNATVNVNMVEHPKVLGWHGVNPVEKRLTMMKESLGNDFLLFRV